MTDLHALLRDAADEVKVPPLDLDGLRRRARRRRHRRRAAVLAAAALLVAVPVGVSALPSLRPAPADQLLQPAPPPTASPAARTVEVTPRLLQVVQIDGSWLDETVPTAAFGRASVVAGKRIDGTSPTVFQAVAVAFAPLELADADCLQRAELVLPRPQADGDGELRAYPSSALSLAEGRLPPNGDRPSALIDSRPYGVETVLPDGRLSYDVTELVRGYATGSPFPSLGRSVPPGSPVVVVLRPPAEDVGDYRRTFDVAASAPVLLASLVEGCSG